MVEDESDTGVLGESLLEVPIAIAEEMAFVGEEKIGPYRVVKPLGEGGMGSVLLCAREEGGFKQTVAMEMISDASR